MIVKDIKVNDDILYMFTYNTLDQFNLKTEEHKTLLNDIPLIKMNYQYTANF